MLQGEIKDRWDNFMTLNVCFNKKKDEQFKKDSKKLIDNLLTKAFETEVEMASYWLSTDFVKKELTSEDKIIFKTKEEAYQFLNSKVDKVVDNFFLRVSEFNSNELLQFILHMENSLASLTNAKLNGEFSWNSINCIDFPKFSENVRKLNTDRPSNKEIIELQLFYHNFDNFLGKIKKSIDIITNVLILNLKNHSTNDKTINIQSLTKLISDSYALWELFHIFKLISKEKEENFNENTIFIENGELKYEKSKEYYTKSAVNNILKDYEMALDEETEIKLQELYYSELGFNIESVSKAFSRKEFLFPCIFSKEELRNKFSQHNSSKSGLGLKGILNLIETDILLDYNQEEIYNKSYRKKFIFSDENKLSIKGIVKVGDQYIFSIGTIYHYCLKLENKMRNPSFVSNTKIKSFIQNFVSEFQLNKISKYLSKNNIWNKIDVNGFDNLLSEKSKKKNTTKQIDLLLYNEKCDEILFVEYKYFLKKSFDKFREIKEESKVESFDKSHIKLLKDLKLKQSEFLKRYSIPANISSKFVLVDVFEERNTLCGAEKLVDDYKVIYMSRVEFEEYLSKNLSQFAKE